MIRYPVSCLQHPRFRHRSDPPIVWDLLFHNHQHVRILLSTVVKDIYRSTLSPESQVIANPSLLYSDGTPSSSYVESIRPPAARYLWQFQSFLHAGSNCWCLLLGPHGSQVVYDLGATRPSCDWTRHERVLQPVRRPFTILGFHADSLCLGRLKRHIPAFAVRFPLGYQTSAVPDLRCTGTLRCLSVFWRIRLVVVRASNP